MSTSISRCRPICSQAIQAAWSLRPRNQRDAAVLVAGLAASVWASPGYLLCYGPYKFFTSDWLSEKLAPRVAAPPSVPLSAPRPERIREPEIPLSDCHWAFDPENPSMGPKLKRILQQKSPSTLGVVVVQDRRLSELLLCPVIAQELVPIRRTGEAPGVNYGEVQFTIPLPYSRETGYAKILYPPPNEGESSSVCRILDLYNQRDGNNYTTEKPYKGVGIALMKTILQYNDEKGHKSSIIEVSASYASHGFYYRLGFRALEEDANEDIRWKLKTGKSTSSLGSVTMILQPEFLKIWRERIRDKPIGFPATS